MIKNMNFLSTNNKSSTVGSSGHLCECKAELDYYKIIRTETIRNATLTLLRMISGARYSGVPHNVHVLPFTLFAKPKSVTCKTQ